MSNISSFIQNQKKTYNSIIIHELIIIILLILSLYIYIKFLRNLLLSFKSTHIKDRFKNWKWEKNKLQELQTY